MIERNVIFPGKTLCLLSIAGPMGLPNRPVAAEPLRLADSDPPDDHNRERCDTKDKQKVPAKLSAHQIDDCGKHHTQRSASLHDQIAEPLGGQTVGTRSPE